MSTNKKKYEKDIVRAISDGTTGRGNGATVNYSGTRERKPPQSPSTTTPSASPETTPNQPTTLKDLLASMGYDDSNKKKAEGYLNQYNNYEPFTFNLNGSALYNQYKDHYTKQAQLARDDAIGKAAALTGGYGNSYAQVVGQQMYDERMEELNNVIPELYNLAYNQHQNEKNDKLTQYQLYSDLDEKEYSRARELAALAAQGDQGGDDESIISIEGLGYIEEELKKAKNNEQIKAILDKYSNARQITALQGGALYALHSKDETKYKNEDGTPNYTEMIKHPELWDYYHDGGYNGFGGVDENAGLVSPNNDKITAKDLIAWLKANNYEGNATEDVVKILDMLGIN